MWKLCKWAFMLLYSGSKILNFGFDVNVTNVLTVRKAMSLRSLRLGESHAVWVSSYVHAYSLLPEG